MVDDFEDHCWKDMVIEPLIVEEACICDGSSSLIYPFYPSILKPVSSASWKAL